MARKFTTTVEKAADIFYRVCCAVTLPAETAEKRAR